MFFVTFLLSVALVLTFVIDTLCLKEVQKRCEVLEEKIHKLEAKESEV